jgi:hypothetical protein
MRATVGVRERERVTASKLPLKSLSYMGAGSRSAVVLVSVKVAAQILSYMGAGSRSAVVLVSVKVAAQILVVVYESA